MFNQKDFTISDKNFDVTDLHKNLTNGNVLITRESLKAKLTLGEKNLLKDVKIHANGKQNSLVIGDCNLLDDCGIFIDGNNNSISIGSNCKLRGTFLMCIGDNNNIIIGDETTIYGEFWGNVHFHAMEATSIKLGKDCMLSGNIVLRTTDGHAIIDKNGQRVNLPKDITIGNHVWIGMNAMILKGSSIPDNSIVGANSVVTKSFEYKDKTTIYIAGNPAKIIKQNKDYWIREKGFNFNSENYKLNIRKEND